MTFGGLERRSLIKDLIKLGLDRGLEIGRYLSVNFVLSTMLKHQGGGIEAIG